MVRWPCQGVTVEWESTPEWAAVMGDEGPWIRNLALAWQLTTSGAPHLHPPPDPTGEFLRSGFDRHAELIAFWAPLAHLLIFGLGWRRPDYGLARWRDLGFSRKDPILDVVFAWWGPERIADYLAWAAAKQPFVGVEQRLAEKLYFEPGRRFFPDDDDLVRRRSTAEWRGVWGDDMDPLHLTGHLFSALEPTAGHDPVPVDRADVAANDNREIPRFYILGETYAGFYMDLPHYKIGKAANGRSVRTDIFVKRVGWMGEYRRHDQTGLWFRGRSHVHLLGQ
jgi:hypothetical protein